MDYDAWFQCIRCPEERYPLGEIVYECRRCGSLLQVQQGLDVLRTVRTGSQWRQLFDRRYMRTTFPYGSSVWGKKEMVCPVRGR